MFLPRVPITRRYTALGYSDYTYEGATDWLVRETWHSAVSGNSFDLVRYWYVNGRPSRVDVVLSAPSDLSTAWSYATYYIQSNWHGDAIDFAPPDGGYAGPYNKSQTVYDPWGNGQLYPPVTLAAWNYYRWNGAWGYLKFDDLGLYYVHGRWYNPDTGMFLSPNEKGDYLYGGDGPCVQDAVNCVWFIQQERNTRTEGQNRVNARVYFLHAIGSWAPGSSIMSPVSTPEVKSQEAYWLYRIEQVVGPQKVKQIPVYECDDFTQHIPEYARWQMYAEIAGYRTWSPFVANYIAQDITTDPLSSGERIIMFGNSGGGTIALSSLALLRDKGINVDQIIARGSPAKIEVLYGARRIDYIAPSGGWWEDKTNYTFGINLRGTLWREFRVTSLHQHVPNSPEAVKEIGDLIEYLLTQ